jgi:subtilisin-like proprotein convertase family protein
VSTKGLHINDLTFSLAESIEIDVVQPIQAIRIGVMIAHAWPQDLEVHLLPPWSEWRGTTSGSFNRTASDLLTFAPLSTSITLLRHLNLAGSASLQYLGNVTLNEMFWLTSPIDPIWGGSQVGEFKGSKQTSVTGVFLPTDGDYSTLGSYQQNKLRRLIGRSPLGKWRLLVGDSEDLDDGLLFRWAIELAYCGDGELLPLVEQCDGTLNCQANCQCPAGCQPTGEGQCSCPGPIRSITETVGTSEYPLEDTYRTMPTDDGDSHVTFFLNTTTNELTAEIIDSDDDNSTMTRVVAINSAFLDASATTEGFDMLSVNSVNDDMEVVFTRIGIESEEGDTIFTVDTFNSSVKGISGVILPNGHDDNIAICISYTILEGYTTSCILTDPEGSERITTTWTTEFNATSPPALLLSSETLLQLYVSQDALWRRTVLASDQLVHAPVLLFNLSSNSDTVQLTVTRNTNGEATVTVVQANGDISIVKIMLNSVQLLSVVTESVTGASQLIATNLDDNNSLLVYSSNNGAELNTRLIGSTQTSSQNIAVGMNIQPNSAIPLSRKRFLVTWADTSQKRQAGSNLMYSAFTTCGNGIAESSKDCDGGPNCNEFCACLPGFYPTVPVSTGCVSACGDNIVATDEDCDGGAYCNNCTCNVGYSPYSPLPLASCAPTCGDGLLVPGEVCDYVGDDSCDTNCRCQYGTVSVNGKCTPSSCGDLYLDLNFEVCDGGSGCTPDCFCYEGYVPTVPPSVACVLGQPILPPGLTLPPNFEEDGSFFETFGFISIILFVLFMVMLAGCVAGTIALSVIVFRRRQARRRQQFFNQNIEMEPKTSAPAPVEPESGVEPVPQTPTSPKKKDVEKDLDFGDLADH